MNHLFGTRIRELRQGKEMSQADLAKVLNITKQAVSVWETNLKETNFDTLIEIARFFDVTTDYLLGLVN